jgi:hypothetical protein
MPTLGNGWAYQVDMTKGEGDMSTNTGRLQDRLVERKVSRASLQSPSPLTATALA